MPTPNKGESKQDFLGRCTKDLIDNEGKKSDQAYAMCNSFWNESHNERPIIELSAPVELAKAKEGGESGKKEFMITAYTGRPMSTWFGPVVFDIAGMKTKEKMPVLREHKRDRIVGFGKSFKDDSNLFVSGEFSEKTEDAREVYDLAKEGYPWQASVSIWPVKVKLLENDKAKEKINGQEIRGPAEIWTESEVGEVSFVTLGRDDQTAAITLSEKAEKRIVIFEENAVEIDGKTKKERPNNMEKITIEILKENAPELLAEIESKSFEAGKQQGVEDERARVIELMDAEADGAETREAIESGIDAADAYKQFYHSEKSKRAQGLAEMANSATKSQGQEQSNDEIIEAKKTPEEQRKEWKPKLGPLSVVG